MMKRLSLAGLAAVATLAASHLADYGTMAGAATFTNNAGQSGTVAGGPPQADLSIVMADSPDPVMVGGTITYTLTASNAGPQPATSVQVLDAIPPGQGLAFVSASGDGWTCGSMIGVVVPCSRPGLAAGATAPPVTVVMTANKVGTVLNTAWVQSATTDPVPGNDSDTEETLVVGQSLFYPLIPCRLADTRGPAGPSGGPALQANASRDFPVITLCGVPADARAVAIIVTVTQATETGNLRLYPAGSNLPTASTINFVTTKARANNAIVTLGSGGAISVRCDMAPASTGTTHFLFDVTGYFR